MRHRRRPFIHILAALVRTTILVLLSALSAHAAEPARSLPVRIVYEARAACGNALEFREAVRQRAPELVDAGIYDAAREFNVGVTLGPDGVMRGKVEIFEPSGANVTRRLEGRDCAEVVDALAFIVAELGRAVSIEGDADAPPEPDQAATAPNQPAPATPQLAAEPALEERAPPERARLRVQAGVGLQALSAMMPDWALGQLVYADLAWTRAGWPSAVTARLSALRAASGTIRGAIGDAEMLWLSLRGEACVRLGREPWWATPCATFDVGWLEATGSRAANTTTKRAVWLSPGLTARATLVALKFLAIEPEVGVLVPLSRPRLFFAGAEGDGETIHRVSEVGFRAGMSLGVLFP